MKKLLLAALMAMSLSACVPAPGSMPVSSQGYAVSSMGSAWDLCYDGIVYSQFSSGNSTWGSVKIDKETKQPVTCTEKK